MIDEPKALLQKALPEFFVSVLKSLLEKAFMAVPRHCWRQALQVF